MGLTFLAAGTSLPEAVSSIIVTNQGTIAKHFNNSFECLFITLKSNLFFIGHGAMGISRFVKFCSLYLENIC